MADNLVPGTDWEKFKALMKKKDEESSATRVDEAALLSHLISRVKGQDPIVKDVARLLHLKSEGKQKDKPICSLLFLGPTGTGKTELAKAITEYLFKDEKAMLRFDCSELSGTESKTRLVGSPLGYIGSEMGGQLTRPVASNPRRLILFDEIEKAYAPVFDLFLQLMGEARLTEQGSGKTVDYSQCVIILTSNSHAEEIGRIQKEMTDYHEMVNAVKGYLVEAKVFRPEILGRIDKVYVFQPLEGMITAEIALQKISRLATQYNLTVEFVAPELLFQALVANDKVSRFGIRELERILFELLAGPMIAAKNQGAKRVYVGADDNGQVIVRPAD